jgi:hypothetical protein
MLQGWTYLNDDLVYMVWYTEFYIRVLINTKRITRFYYLIYTCHVGSIYLFLVSLTMFLVVQTL